MTDHKLFRNLFLVVRFFVVVVFFVSLSLSLSSPVVCGSLVGARSLARFDNRRRIYYNDCVVKIQKILLFFPPPSSSSIFFDNYFLWFDFLVLFS